MGQAADPRARERAARRHVLSGAALVGVMLALGACQSVAPPPSATLAPTPTVPPPPVILKINLGKAPDTIDPALVGPLDEAGGDMVANLFAGLTFLDGDSGEVKPMLAKDWTTSDQITWQVSLRDDVFWVRINPDTGQLEKVRAVTAGDAVAAVLRTCRPDTHAPMIRAAMLIKGCAEVNQQDPAQLTDASLAQTIAVRALNDTELEYTLTGPAAYFPTILSMPALAPIPVEQVAGLKADWTRPDNLWTSGPFTVRPGVPTEQGYALVVNSFWPLERTGNVAGLEIVFDADSDKSLAGLNAGELALTTLPSAQIAQVSFQDDPRYRLLVTPAVTFIALSYDTPPLDNPNLRRALSLALDRQAIVKSILAPQGVAGLPATALVPPGSADAPDYGQAGVPGDADAARAALAAGGFAGCARLPDLILLTDDSPLSKSLATEYVRQWNEVFGCPEGVIKVQAEPLENSLIALRTPPENLHPRRAGLITLGWQGDYPDSYHWLADILGCPADFPAAYLNQKRDCGEVDSRIAQAASTAAAAARRSIYQAVEDALFGAGGEMPVIPVYDHARALAIGARLEVYPIHAGPLRFDQWVQDQ